MIILKESVDIFLKHNTGLYATLKDILKDIGEYYIAGGAARQVFLGEIFGETDIDLYVPDYAKAKWGLQSKGWNQKRASTYAWTFVHPSSSFLLQIVNNAARAIEEIFESFDFYCCQFALKDDILFYTEEARKDALGKLLRLSSEQKECRADRLIKYALKKHYTPSCPYTEDRFEKVVRWMLSCEDRNIDADTWFLYINDLLDDKWRPQELKEIMYPDGYVPEERLAGDVGLLFDAPMVPGQIIPVNPVAMNELAQVMQNLQHLNIVQPAVS